MEESWRLYDVFRAIDMPELNRMYEIASSNSKKGIDEIIDRFDITSIEPHTIPEIFLRFYHRWVNSQINCFLEDISNPACKAVDAFAEFHRGFHSEAFGSQNYIRGVACRVPRLFRFIKEYDEYEKNKEADE